MAYSSYLMRDPKMRTLQNSQTGFGHLAVLIVVGVLLVVASTGYLVIHNTSSKHTPSKPATAKSSSHSGKPSAAPQTTTSTNTATPSTPKTTPTPSPTPTITHPTLANCQGSGSFIAYYYLTGGTNGYASTGQALPGDAGHANSYSPDSYLDENPAPSVTVDCVKDASGNYVNGWGSNYVIHGQSTYLKFQDLSLAPQHR